ncbi:MAG: alpha/beta fold hydrolase [Burkholderiales bacterium]
MGWSDPSGCAESSPAPADAGLGPPLRWLPGGHAQTIWPALFARRHAGPAPRFRRERWDTPDGDFVDADWLVADPLSPTPTPTPSLSGLGVERPLLVMFHGLEGSSASGYALAFADWACRHGWDFVMPHFRGCSGSVNRAPRAYHSGDFEEIGWMLARARGARRGPLVAVGISLGGNALLRWAEEAGDAARHTAQAVAAVCSPVDLMAGGLAIGEGFNRWLYTPMFLRTMKPKALAKLAQYPGLFNRERLLAARTLYDFDDVFTAPLHGFRDVRDYWTRASAKPTLADIRLPALVLNARNDPFVPAHSLPRQEQVGRHVTLWQPLAGGHAGFAGGAFPSHVMALPAAVMGWLAARL